MISDFNNWGTKMFDFKIVKYENNVYYKKIFAIFKILLNLLKFECRLIIFLPKFIKVWSDIKEKKNKSFYEKWIEL